MTSNRYPKLHELVADNYPEAYQTMLLLHPGWYEEMARREPERLLMVAKVAPRQIINHWAKWNDFPYWQIDRETGKPIGYPPMPEGEEHAAAFGAAADAYEGPVSAVGTASSCCRPPSFFALFRLFQAVSRRTLATFYPRWCRGSVVLPRRHSCRTPSTYRSPLAYPPLSLPTDSEQLYQLVGSYQPDPKTSPSCSTTQECFVPSSPVTGFK